MCMHKHIDTYLIHVMIGHEFVTTVLKPFRLHVLNKTILSITSNWKVYMKLLLILSRTIDKLIIIMKTDDESISLNPSIEKAMKLPLLHTLNHCKGQN